MIYRICYVDATCRFPYIANAIPTIAIASGTEIKPTDGPGWDWGRLVELVEPIELVIDEIAGPLTNEITPSPEALVNMSVMLFRSICT